MNIRLDNELEQKLSYFAHELHTTKTELVKPYILRMLEDSGKPSLVIWVNL